MVREAQSMAELLRDHTRYDEVPPSLSPVTLSSPAIRVGVSSASQLDIDGDTLVTYAANPFPMSRAAADDTSAVTATASHSYSAAIFSSSTSSLSLTCSHTATVSSTLSATASTFAPVLTSSGLGLMPCTTTGPPVSSHAMVHDSPLDIPSARGTAVNASNQHGEYQACLLGQKLPPISKFSGDDLDIDGETFQKWIEQFELIAAMCRWNDQAKLVNLTPRLKGQAYSFYRTCNPAQRSGYDELKAQLARRFTPV